MDFKKVAERIKEKLLRVRKQEVYQEVIKWMWKLGADCSKNAIRTKELEEKVPHVGTYLKNLKKARLVDISETGSAPFLLDCAAQEKEKRFLYIYPEIKEVRAKRSLALIDHIQNDHELLILSLQVLGLDETASIVNILGCVQHSEDRSEDKKNLKNYNGIVKKFKENKIVLKGYDELGWRCGNHSWYLNEKFVVECS